MFIIQKAKLYFQFIYALKMPSIQQNIGSWFYNQ